MDYNELAAIEYSNNQLKMSERDFEDEEEEFVHNCHDCGEDLTERQAIDVIPDEVILCKECFDERFNKLKK